MRFRDDRRDLPGERRRVEGDRYVDEREERGRYVDREPTLRDRAVDERYVGDERDVSRVAPRREAYVEREPRVEREPYVEERAVHREPPVVEREYASAAPMGERGVAYGHREGFSTTSTLMGWAVATFFTLLITAVLGALFGTPLPGDAGLTGADIGESAIVSVVVLLVAVFVGYFLGGFTAGRMAGFKGGAHGLGVVGWTLLFAVLAALAGNALNDRFNLVATYAPNVDFGALTGPALLTLVVTLLVMAGAAYLGGRVGDRSWWTERETRYARHERRGRPL